MIRGWSALNPRARRGSMRSNEVTARARKSELLLSARKVAGVTGFFIAVGPLVGFSLWLVAITGVISLAPPVHSERALGKIGAVFFIIIYGIPFSYLFGLVPATFAGMAIGTAQVKYGRLGWPVVLMIGAGVGVVDIFIGKEIAMFLAAHSTAYSRANSLNLGFIVQQIGTCAVATLVCWRFVRKWYADSPLESVGDP